MEYVAVLLPSVAVGVIFYFAMRAIFGADRAEREAQASAERQFQAKDPDTSPDHLAVPIKGETRSK
ncbi:hypothetical protein [Arthrobacter sp. 260]|uniref:hypothetical protein n=1 Tax=Arthrobacter sp. 260 TaxID=2735314 RepID=UPI00320AE99F